MRKQHSLCLALIVVFALLVVLWALSPATADDLGGEEWRCIMDAKGKVAILWNTGTREVWTGKPTGRGFDVWHRGIFE